MLETSVQFKNYLIKGGQPEFHAHLYKKNTDGTKTEFRDLEDDDFVQNSWSFKWDSCANEFQIGGGCVSSFEFKLNNSDYRFEKLLSSLDGYIIEPWLQCPESVEEYLDENGYVQTKITYIGGDEPEKLYMGVYTIQAPTSTSDILSCTAYDNLYAMSQLNFIETFEDYWFYPINYLGYCYASKERANQYYLNNLQFARKIITSKYVNLAVDEESFAILENEITEKYPPTVFLPTEVVREPIRAFFSFTNLEGEPVMWSTGAWIASTLPTETLEMTATNSWDNKTVLDVLIDIAQTYGCFIRCTQDGKIAFVRYDTQLIKNISSFDGGYFDPGRGFIENIDEEQYDVNEFRSGIEKDGGRMSTWTQKDSLDGGRYKLPSAKTVHNTPYTTGDTADGNTDTKTGGDFTITKNWETGDVVDEGEGFTDRPYYICTNPFSLSYAYKASKITGFTVQNVAQKITRGATTLIPTYTKDITGNTIAYPAHSYTLPQMYYRAGTNIFCLSITGNSCIQSPLDLNFDIDSSTEFRAFTNKIRNNPTPNGCYSFAQPVSSEEVANRLYDLYADLPLREFTVSCVGDPTIQPGDAIVMFDTKSRMVVSVISHVTYSAGGLSTYSTTLGETCLEANATSSNLAKKRIELQNVAKDEFVQSWNSKYFKATDQGSDANACRITTLNNITAAQISAELGGEWKVHQKNNKYTTWYMATAPSKN